MSFIETAYGKGTNWWLRLLGPKIHRLDDSISMVWNGHISDEERDGDHDHLIAGEQFDVRVKRDETSLIVLHESVTRTRASALRVLVKRGLSVHYTVDRDGSVHQHAEDDDYCQHAGSDYNRRSIAVEFINRYYGERASDETVVDTVWAHKGKYILPTPEQCEAGYKLVKMLCAKHGIRPMFPGIKGDDPEVFIWGRINGLEARQATGIMAHHRWKHADALFFERYIAARMDGHGKKRSFMITKRDATSGSRATSIEVA